MMVCASGHVAPRRAEGGGDETSDSGAGQTLRVQSNAVSLSPPSLSLLSLRCVAVLSGTTSLAECRDLIRVSILVKSSRRQKGNVY